MGNLASFCINPDEEKQGTTLFAAISRRLNCTPGEEPSEKSELVGYVQEQERIVEVQKEYQEPESNNKQEVSKAAPHETENEDNRSQDKEIEQEVQRYSVIEREPEITKEDEQVKEQENTEQINEQVEEQDQVTEQEQVNEHNEEKEPEHVQQKEEEQLIEPENLIEDKQPNDLVVLDKSHKDEVIEEPNVKEPEIEIPAEVKVVEIPTDVKVVEIPVSQAEPFIMLDIQSFDFDSLKNFHRNVEFVSFEDIKAATAPIVLESEQEFSTLDYTDFQAQDQLVESHELPPCSYGDEPEIYHGYWNNQGWQEGRGYLIKKDGSKYEGIWKNGQLIWGRIYYLDGSVYQGNVLSSQPHGLGTLNTAQKKVLEGNFQEGEMVNGTIEFERTFYEGDVWNHVPHGQGEYKDINYHFVGEWNSGRRVNGKLVFADGTSFIGKFNENLPYSGKFTWNNGTTYEGDLKNSGGSHQGVLENPSGSYTGLWNGYSFNGKGIYRWKNDKNNVYEGEYRLGKREGKGVYNLNSEDIFRATWKAGKPDGDCEYVQNGRIIKSRWRKGNFLNVLGESQKGDEGLFDFVIEEEVNNMNTLPHLPQFDDNKTESFSNKFRASDIK